MSLISLRDMTRVLCRAMSRRASLIAATSTLRRDARPSTIAAPDDVDRSRRARRPGVELASTWRQTRVDRSRRASLPRVAPVHYGDIASRPSYGVALLRILHRNALFRLENFCSIAIRSMPDRVLSRNSP